LLLESEILYKGKIVLGVNSNHGITTVSASHDVIDV